MVSLGAVLARARQLSVSALVAGTVVSRAPGSVFPHHVSLVTGQLQGSVWVALKPCWLIPKDILLMKHVGEPLLPSGFQGLTEGGPPPGSPKENTGISALLRWLDLGGGALPGLIHHFATAHLTAAPAAGLPELASQTHGA